MIQDEHAPCTGTTNHSSPRTATTARFNYDYRMDCKSTEADTTLGRAQGWVFPAPLAVLCADPASTVRDYAGATTAVRAQRTAASARMRALANR